MFARGGWKGCRVPSLLLGFLRAFSTCCSQQGEGRCPAASCVQKKNGIFKARKQQIGLGRSKALTPYGSIGFRCCGGCSAPTFGFGLNELMLEQIGAGSARQSQPVVGIWETSVTKYIVIEPDFCLFAEIIRKSGSALLRWGKV